MRKAHKDFIITRSTTRVSRRDRVNVEDVLKGMMVLDKHKLYGLSGMALLGLAKSCVFNEELSKQDSGDRTSQIQAETYILSAEDYVKNPFNLRMLSDIAMFSIIHTACMDTLSYDLVGNGYYLESEESESKQLEITDWLENINNNGESITDVLFKMMMCSCLTGNYCAEVVPDKLNTTIIEVNHVNARKIQPHRTVFMQNSPLPLFKYMEDTGYKPVYFKKYGVEDEWLAKEGIKARDTDPLKTYATELAWFSEYFPSLAPFYGLPKLVPGWSTSELYNHQRVSNLSWFETMGMKYAIVVQGQLDDTGKAYLDDYLESEGTGEVLKTLVLYAPTGNVMFDIKDMSAKFPDSMMKSINEIAMRELFMLWRVPPSRVGSTMDVGSLGGNSVYEATNIYMTTVLKRKQQRLNQFVTGLIKRKYQVENIKFILNPIDNSDPEIVIKKAEYGFTHGQLTRKQSAEFAGIPHTFEKGEGEDYYMKNGIVPIELAGASPSLEGMLKMIETEESKTLNQQR